ncbi:MAG: hypothetical protein MUE35_12965 [Hydrogenophaga sp.]|jgi:hypothetical protein|nr:hypothetical protein [Hydrogenophaga sp.]
MMHVMVRRAAVGAAVAGLIAGCGTPPQTPQGFRAVVRDGHSLFQIDTFTVDRPLSVVGGALQRKADECLHARVTTHGAGVFGFGSGSSQVRAVSTPTVRRSSDRVELDLQVDVKASIKVHAEPPGGVVSFAVDAVPAGPGRTRVEVYRMKLRSAPLLEAVRGWASGEFTGCPDPTTYM